MDELLLATANLFLESQCFQRSHGRALLTKRQQQLSSSPSWSSTLLKAKVLLTNLAKTTSPTSWALQSRTSLVTLSITALT